MEPMESFGVRLPGAVRKALNTYAEANGMTPNRAICEILSNFFADAPLTKLDQIEQEALQGAHSAVQGELQAIETMRATMQGKVATLETTLRECRAEADQLRHELFTGQDVTPVRVHEIQARLAQLDTEIETLTARLQEARRALADVEGEAEAVRQRAGQTFAEVYEAKAWEILREAITRTAGEMADLFALALVILGRTRDLNRVDKRLRVLRYVEHSLWALISKTDKDLDLAIVKYAAGKNLSLSFSDWRKVCNFFDEDFPQRPPSCGGTLSQQGRGALNTAGLLK